MKPILTVKEFNRMTEEYDKVKIQCKHCYRRVIVPVWVDKIICPNCGYYVYRNKQLEFQENIKKLIKEK